MGNSGSSKSGKDLREVKEEIEENTEVLCLIEISNIYLVPHLSINCFRCCKLEEEET